MIERRRWPVRRPACLSAICTAIAVLAAAPAVSGAHTLAVQSFGSDLVAAPSPITHPSYHGAYADCNDFAEHPCTLSIAGVRSGNALPAGAPIPGVVVRFRIRSLTTDAVAFRIVREQAFPVWRGVGTGPSITLGGSGAVETYAASPSIPVQIGDQPGFDDPVTPIAQTANCDARGDYFEFSPPLPNGGVGDIDASSTCELLVNADVEPDLDRDGRGDVSEDASVHVPDCGYLQVGTAGNDLLEGFPLGDRIRGLGGRDRLQGLAGDDCLLGGPGDDRLAGGAGTDTLNCGPGEDTVTGAAGDDLHSCEHVHLH